jgi:hypothetical protein
VSRQPLGLVLVLFLPIIADHLELWKKISIEHDGYLNLEKLSKDRRNIKITKIKRKDGAFFAGDEELKLKRLKASKKRLRPSRFHTA